MAKEVPYDERRSLVGTRAVIRRSNLAHRAEDSSGRKRVHTGLVVAMIPGSMALEDGRTDTKTHSGRQGNTCKG